MSNNKISVYVRIRPVEDESVWSIKDEKQISKKDTGIPAFTFGLNDLKFE